MAGQHVDVRLTASDGYQATRSYSLSSGPSEAPWITVERVDGGEVSPYLVDVAEGGDHLEVRGPLGGYFVWEPDHRPLFLVGGGSGIAPLRSMWRAGSVETRVVYSARTEDRLIFRDELSSTERLHSIVHLTREVVPGFMRGRLDSRTLADAIRNLSEAAVYVCGPTGFVESVADALTALLGVDHPIKTERFG